MNATCRQLSGPRWSVLSYELPLNPFGAAGIPFHSLHATSHALQPMHSVTSVKKPFAEAIVSRYPPLAPLTQGTEHPPVVR